ncbi:MAG: flagellar hook-length control protein FliK [Candidatus Omnitrophica bacterium]|nr:flagellar hook-length control protein FliK [Candidatus Omnitrophota bacterium]
MDDSLQVMMPLEGSQSVYSIVYPEGTTPTSGNGEDFFQFLLAQLTSSGGTNTTQGIENFLSFQPLQITSDGDDTGGENAGGETNANLITNMFSFPLLSEIAESISPELAGLQYEEIVDGGTEMQFAAQPEVPTGESSVWLEGKIFNPMPFSIDSEGTSRVGENTGDVKSAISLVSDDTATQSTIFGESGFSEEGTKNVVPEARTFETAQVINQQSERISVTDTFIGNTAYDGKSEELLLQKTGELANQRYPVNSTEENGNEYAVDEFMADSPFVEKNEVLFSLLNRGELSKLDLATARSLSTAFDNSSAAPADVNAETSITFGDANANFASSKQSMTSNNFFDVFENNEFTNMETAEQAGKGESTFEGRVRQAQEAQSVAQQIVKSAHFRQGIKVSEFSLSLEPEYLGNLKVSIAMEGDTIFAKIAARSAYTHDMLSSNLSALKESFNNAGIKFDAIEVSMDEGESGFESFQTEENFQQGEAASNNASFRDFNPFEYVYEERQPAMHDESVSNVLNGAYHIDYLA